MVVSGLVVVCDDAAHEPTVGATSRTTVSNLLCLKPLANLHVTKLGVTLAPTAGNHPEPREEPG